MFSKSVHLIEVKNRIFKMILALSCIAFTAVAIVNIVNKRPISNFLVPFFGAIIAGVLLILFWKKRYTRQIKYGYMFFLCILYLPVAWLTSPGSYSAMSFYAVLIFFVGIIMSQEVYDYLFPLASVVEVLFFLNYEATKPSQYTLYTDTVSRGYDLSINFIIVAVTIFSIMIVLNNYFDTEHKRIYHLSITDQLTGIFNRRHLYQALETYHNNSNSADNFVILMMDLNNFKKVNDTFGHVAGDRVLKEFGDVLNNSCRKHDLPVRYGGDEFILILPDTSVQDVESIKNRINELFSDTMSVYKSVGLAISFGVANSVGKSIDEIMQQADDHLYKNKEESKRVGQVN
ncbi:GGDEF domain-containing protein [Fusibacter bizertensis]|uniref:GGDEF domain-containing protein n=1 Tax=Fusibacter bizertensis TaxID=1488331 RepID=A0ABT6NGH8_9FIRM|nr:GGDEF domain-containing protein [Fusibacter bizertensis]MDH8679502.1 GGDEF domain-containing protein [Fusibacter bizertensis]